MHHPLQRKIDALRRRQRLTDAVRGVCLAVTVLVVAVAVLGTVDFVLQLQDRGVRIIFSLAVLGILGWATYHFLLKTFFSQLAEDELARRVEGVFPALRNRLLDAVQFLRRPDDDPTAGSAALRRAVIESVATDAEVVDFCDVVDRRRPIRAVALLMAVAIPVVISFILIPSIARTALARIVDPLGDQPWPHEAGLGSFARTEGEPPAIQSLSIRLIPPDYSGLPSTDARHGISALSGTRMEISGTTDQPLQAATLYFENGEKTETPASVAPDGLSFTIGKQSEAFVVERSGEYWIELIGRNGATGAGDRWPVEALPDEPPTVEMQRPAADLYVTPSAAAPIRITVTDDLAVAWVALAYQLSESAAERLLTLSEANVRQVDYRWNFAPLEFSPGMKVTFQAVAADKLEQTGRSERRRLIVVSLDELLDRLAERVKLIVSELGRGLEMQRGCRDRVEKLRASLLLSGPLRQADVDLLQSVRHAQEEVDRLLSAGGEGLPVHVRTLLAELENNRVDNPSLKEQMESLLDELTKLKRRQLSAVDRALAAVVKSARLELEGQGGAARIAAELEDATENQNAVIRCLQAWIDRLNRSDESGGMILQLGRLLLDQQSNLERTKAVGRRTLARRVADLSERDAAELAAAAVEQLALAGRLEKLYVGQVGNLSQDTSTGQVDNLSYVAVDASMRDAAERIEQNRIGLAVAAQKKVVEDLQKILGRAADDGQSEPNAGKTAVEIEGDNGGEKAVSEEIAGRPGQQPGSATEEARTHETPDTQLTRSRILRLWGELPSRDREAMIHSSLEQFPPEYEALIEEYFRRLAVERGEGREERGERVERGGGREERGERKEEGGEKREEGGGRSG